MLLGENAMAQKPNFGTVSGGLASSISIGQNQQAVYGFSVKVNTGSLVFKQFNLPINAGTPATAYTNAALYRSTSSNSYSSGTVVGIVNLTNSGSVTITNLQETITTTPVYYFLVVDVVGSSGQNQQFRQNYGDILGYDSGNTTYTAGTNADYNGNYINYNVGSGSTAAYAITLAPNSSGLSSASTPIVAGTTGLYMYGFSITNRSGSSISFSKLQIQTTGITDISQYFTNIRLVSGTATTPGSTSVSGLSVSSTSGGYLVFTNSGTGFSVAANTTSYFYLAMDAKATFSGSIPANVQFNITYQQSSAALTDYVPANPNSPYNHFTAYGNTYNLNYTSITVASLPGGISSTTLTAHQTDIVLFGFSVTSSGAVTLSGFNINSTGGASTYFSNAKLYRNGSGTYPSSPVQVGTALMSGNFAVITGLSETFTAGQTKYYFLVADNIGGGANSSTTIAFNFTSGQSSDAITQSAPATSSYNTFAITGSTFNIPPPGIYTVSANSQTANGISSAALYYGRTNIVLFGYGVEAYGAGITYNSTGIVTSGTPSNYFSNIRVYRSTSPTFPGGTATYNQKASGANTPGIYDCNCGYYLIDKISETIPANTTYYYFIVADYTNSGGSAPNNITFSVSTGQANYASQVLIDNPYSFFNPSSFSGQTFNIINTEEWKGTISGDMNNASNYVAKGSSSGGFTPTGTTIVRVGGVTYTNAPNINADLAIGGLAIENNATVNLNATATLGSTLTLNSGLTIGTGATLNFGATGLSGKITLANGSISYIESTGVLNLTGATTVDNSANTTGSFTLKSSSSGTATIGTLPTTASIKGTFVVQRYFTGGSLSNRGYRLMSSPVNNSGTNPLAALPTLTTAATYNFSSLKTNLLITGAGGSGSGFDQPSGYTANGATILFYTPTSATAGKFTFPASPSSTAGVGSGFYFYFRGDNATNVVYKVIKSGNYATPEANVVGLQSGTLNQQGFRYTLASVNGGYNLLGNPYPSAIKLNSTALTAANTTQMVYTYTPGGSSISAHSVSGSNTWTVASGQGFFVQAPSTSSGGTVSFTESLKTTTQPALLLGTPTTMQEGDIQLQMVQDSANYDFAQLRFMDTYDKNFIENEDANDLNGSGQAVFFGAMTADNHLVAIASQPLDKKNTSVYLSVNDNNSGTFKINKVSLTGIPDKFDVWLMDHFKKDSINLRKDSTYSFTMDKTNAATYGNARMEVVIRTKMLPPYQLLTFTGKRNSNSNVLNWTVKNEYTYTYFELERSFDNKTFEGVNNSYSTGTGSYTFTDQSNKPLIYYRLKQTDINENVTYSAVIILKSDSNNIFSVYPNPTDNTLHFALSQDVKTSVTLRVYNSMGTLMKIRSYNNNSGDQDVSTLTPGSYMVELIDDSTKKLIASSKFIKL